MESVGGWYPRPNARGRQPCDLPKSVKGRVCRGGGEGVIWVARVCVEEKEIAVPSAGECVEGGESVCRVGRESVCGEEDSLATCCRVCVQGVERLCRGGGVCVKLVERVCVEGREIAVPHTGECVEGRCVESVCKMGCEGVEWVAVEGVCISG